MCPFDDDKTVDWSVSEFYEKSKVIRAIQPLTAMIDSGIPELQLTAIEGLSGIVSKHALEALQRLTDHENKDIRDAAKKACEKVKRSIKEYDEAFNDEDKWK